MTNVRVRIAPSPTGFLHIGRTRTILFNYLFAKKYGGKMIFRIEDTDKARSKKEYQEDILQGLDWLGIAYDEGPFLQSERTALYQKYIHDLIEKGNAYEAEESTEGGGKVIRLKNRNEKVTFQDHIRGEVTIDTTDLGDFIIARNINEPLYNFTVVVDDHEMKITHIIRGDDGISNTPRQILIQEAIGAIRPEYAHVPLILGSDRSKLSGRHGAVSLNEYRKAGYLPEAMINYLALLGWHPEGTHGEKEPEIFSLNELIKSFDISRIQKGGAMMNLEKLNWINKHYIDNLSDEAFLDHARQFVTSEVGKSLDIFGKVFRGRISYFSQISDELKSIFEPPEYPGDLLLWNGKLEKNNVSETLDMLYKKLSELSESHFEDFSKLEAAISPFFQERARGGVLWPLRAALSGKRASLGPFELALVLGKEKSLERITIAQKKLS